MANPGSDLSKNRHGELVRDQDAAEIVDRVKLKFGTVPGATLASRA